MYSKNVLLFGQLQKICRILLNFYIFNNINKIRFDYLVVNTGLGIFLPENCGKFSTLFHNLHKIDGMGYGIGHRLEAMGDRSGVMVVG